MLLKPLFQVGLLLLIANASVAQTLVAPSSLTATPHTADSIALSWVGTSQGNVNYVIERSESPTTGFVTVGSTTWLETVYLDAGLPSGVTFYYQVRAVYGGSTSDYSDVASATTSDGVTATTVETSSTSTTTPTTSTSTSSASTTTPTSTTIAAGPVANAGPDQLTQTLMMVTFDGSESSDPGGTITSYAWTFGDGGVGSGMSASHAYARPGLYTATLIVIDDRGLRAADTAFVLVMNHRPIANAGPDQTQAVGAGVSFTGTGSDPDGTITSYRWKFGDGASGNGAAATHAYATPGSYTATLTVTDDRGAQGTDTALVTVTSGTGAPPWVRRFGSSGIDIGFGVATDATGNVILTGRVNQSADLGGVVCPPVSLFVAKYSATGDLQWARCFFAYGEGRAVTVDGDGNILVTGNFGGTVDFGGGPVSSNGARGIFVVKYSPVGAHLWSRAFGNGGYSLLSSGNGVAVDGAGDVVLTGAFSETVNFGGEAMTSLGNSDIFTAKFSGADGSHLWSKHVGTSGYWGNGGKAVAVDGGGNVVVTGTFGGTADFGAGPVTASGVAMFVTKYSPSGVAMWTRMAGGHLDDSGNGVVVDAAGNVIVTGQAYNGTEFGTGWLFGGGDDNAFLVEFTSAGTPVWAKIFGSGGADAGRGIALDAAGNIVLTGNFSAMVDFGGGALVTQGSSDVFVAKLSPAGGHIWSKSFGSTRWDAGNAVAVGAGGAPIVTGQFFDTVNFGSGTLTSAGSYDIFLSSLTP